MLQFGLHHLSGHGLVYGVTLANTLPQTPTFSSIIPYLHYARVHVKVLKTCHAYPAGAGAPPSKKQSAECSWVCSKKWEGPMKLRDW